MLAAEQSEETQLNLPETGGYMMNPDSIGVGGTQEGEFGLLCMGTGSCE